MKMKATIAEASIANIVSMYAAIDTTCAWQRGVFNHLPINIGTLVEITWRTVF